MCHNFGLVNAWMCTWQSNTWWQNLKMNHVMMSAFDGNCKMGSYQMWFNVWSWNAVARTSDEQIKMIGPCQTSWNTYMFVRCWYFITGKQLFSSNSWPTELLQHSSLPLDGYSRTYTNITNISLYKYMLGPISLTQLSLDGHIRTYTNITDQSLSLSDISLCRLMGTIELIQTVQIYGPPHR